ncbi:hypothetical protein [Pareuzebyella sediminis]|uniref:hypothetical protein n=1 Tax=Pareuzebyella sediminis TaxID=2607998 RepID=UPI0011EFBDE8|nr:hypothetical protein [Pareuzebyella sediminis]
MKRNIDVDELFFLKVRALAKAEETTMIAVLKKAVQCYLAQTSKKEQAPIEENLADLLLVQDVDTSIIVDEKALLYLLAKTHS